MFCVSNLKCPIITMPEVVMSSGILRSSASDIDAHEASSQEGVTLCILTTKHRQKCRCN